MGERAVLVASFGTSHHEALEKSILPTEMAVAQALPGRTLYRAFTSGMILRKLARRDGLFIDDVPQALERLAKEGVTDVVIQPTHIINGDEYEKLCNQARTFEQRFSHLRVGTPLLTAMEDYVAVAAALLDQLPLRREDTALVYMGHGTEHHANAAYALLEYLLHDMGRRDICIGTVESYPGFAEVLRRLRECEARKVILYPLMLVAGDHAQNDLAGDDEASWKSMLTHEGYEVTCNLQGLGESPGTRALFAGHARAAEEER